MNYRGKKELAAHLTGLGNRAIMPLRSYGGICSEINRLADDGHISHTTVRHVIRLMREWPEYSGSPSYPVPHPHLGSPSDAFHFADDLWAATPYGDARRRLCIWLAEQILAQHESGSYSTPGE